MATCITLALNSPINQMTNTCYGACKSGGMDGDTHSRLKK